MESCKQSVLSGIARASAAKAELVSFPENCLGLGCPDARPLSEEDLLWVGAAAKEHAIDVCLGVIEATPTKPSNSLFWFSGQDGRVKAVYRKMHLFDFGELQESAKIAAGSELVAVPVRDSKVGLSICYDLRFPGMFLKLARAGCGLFLAPSAFTAATGEAHFRKLVTARALDTQAYVVAAAQAGVHSATRRSWGESMIVGTRRRKES